MRIDVRFYGDLADLAGEAHVTAPIGEPRSVKDVIESVGVPHPEVALILVDDQPVDFDHLVVGGERVAAYPPFHELALSSTVTVLPDPICPRFVLDVHLGTLTRRLRLLGFDCWYRNDTEDAELARIAVDEQRILLTRDRQLLMRRVITHGYGPRSPDPDTQALEVIRRYDLADRIDPFSRCVHCNGEIVRVAKAEVLDELPPRTREAFDDFARCRGCDQVYWPGSHLEAVDSFLARVRSEARTG